MNQYDYKRIILTGDWHFGCHSNSKSWLYSSRDYFKKVFIPWLKENARPDDLLLHLGDLYENRTSIEQHVNDIAVDVVEEISKILPFWIIVGNHDIYKKTTNEINALKNIKYLPNVKVFTKPEMIQIGSKKAFLMPWVGKKRTISEQEVIQKSGGGDYLFCHTDFRGAKFNRAVTIQDGLVIDEDFHYDRIFSGHIHMRQELFGNQLTFVGTPYQITRADRDNQKGFYILDVESSKDKFIPNKYSPEFIKIHLSDYYDKTLNQLYQIIDNNFVDLYLENKLIADTSIFNFIAYIENRAKSLDPFFYSNTYDFDDIKEDIDKNYNFGSELDITVLMKKRVEKLEYSDRVKTKLIEHLKTLHQKALNENNFQ